MEMHLTVYHWLECLKDSLVQLYLMKINTLSRSLNRRRY